MDRIPLPLEQLAKIFLNEAFLYRRALVLGFIGIVASMLVAGLFQPKGYSSSITILVGEKNIIQPLMQGTAVPTEVTDRAAIARETIYGRRIMDQILEQVGWLKNNPPPEEREAIIARIKKSTTVANVGKNLLKIEYHDRDPERAYVTTQKLAELFIAEALSAKTGESRAAFEFIDKQVGEYHDKLMRVEDRLKEVRSTNIEVSPGSEAEIGQRISRLMERIQQTTQELNEAKIKQASLESQLTGEAETATLLTREGQYRIRMAELQNELERLRLTLHDTHPDIVRTRHQIEDLREAAAAEKAKAATRRATGQVPIDESLIANPLYQQLRRDVSQAKTMVATLEARLKQHKDELQAELQRGKLAHGGEVTLAELMRDYEVNRGIYQDLLKRRENARVSMNLDIEKQGLTFKIQEPAHRPHRPSGLVFEHFAIGGLLLGLLLPAGLLFAKQQVDPRLRSVTQIEAMGLPVAAAVAHFYTPAETAAIERQLRHLRAAVVGTVVVAAVAIGFSLAGVM